MFIPGNYFQSKPKEVGGRKPMFVLLAWRLWTSTILDNDGRGRGSQMHLPREGALFCYEMEGDKYRPYA